MAGARSSDRLACTPRVRRRCEAENPCPATSSGCAATPASAASTMPSRDPLPRCPPALPASVTRPARSGSGCPRSWPSSGCSPGSIAACSPPTARRMRSGSRRSPRSQRYGTMVKSPNGYPDADALCGGGQQAGRHHGADRRRARHDAELPHPHPGRRQAARGSLRGVPARPWLEPPGTTRSPPTHGRWPRGRSSPTAWSAWPASAISRISAAALRGACASMPQAAQHAIAFFGFLRHSKGEWAGADLRPRSLAGVRRRLPVRLAARRWPATVPHRLLRRAPQERQEHAVRRHRPLPAGRRRRAGRRDLLGRDHARSGAHRVRRGQAHGRLLPCAQAPGPGADQQPERRGQRLALHAAILRCQLHGRPERAWCDHRRAACPQDPPRGRCAGDRHRRQAPAAAVRDHHRRLRPPQHLLRAPRLRDQAAGGHAAGRQLVRVHRRRRRG